MSVSSDHRRSVVLRRRPHGAPAVHDFEVIEGPIPEPGPGEVVTHTLWLSIDPYMRGRLSEAKSYAKPVEAGEAPLSTYLGVLGMPGVTAYSGITDIGQPKAGETVVISAASGAVGSVAGQLAKRAGARVVGIAGGPDKCLFAQEVLCFDDCVDHRVTDLPAALRAACPHGIDVYFENVGGAVQRAVFPLLNDFGRMIMCGMVSEYNDTQPQPGPNLMSVVRKRLRIQGLIVGDKPERFAEWRALATPWVRDGTLHYREDIVDGLESAPEALVGLLSGRNFGKLVVRVTPEAA